MLCHGDTPICQNLVCLDHRARHPARLKSMVNQDVFVKQMPPIMANSKDGQGHKDKYLDNRGKVLSQKMLMCNIKATIFIKK